MRITDHGLKFDSTARIVGKYTAAAPAAFLLGELWGCVREDGTGILFVRPTSELNEAERGELADYVTGQWRRFKEG